MELRPKKILRGRYSEIRIFDDQDHFAKWKRGEMVDHLRLPDFDNGITDTGIHYVENVAFKGVTQITSWFAGLINGTGFTGVAGSDTSASHGGWTELTSYDEATRIALSFSTPASRAMTATVSFTMNATATAQGLLIASSNTKNSTVDTLFSTGIFPTPPSLISGNVFTANYTLAD